MTIIKLQHPVTTHGAAVKELTMRRPKVRDMLAADKLGGSDAEKEIRTFANLCEAAPETIEDLDLADYQALQKAYGDFLS